MKFPGDDYLQLPDSDKEKVKKAYFVNYRMTFVNGEWTDEPFYKSRGCSLIEKAANGQLLLDGVALKLGEEIFIMTPFYFSDHFIFMVAFTYFMYDENDPHCFLRIKGWKYNAAEYHGGKKEWWGKRI